MESEENVDKDELGCDILNEEFEEGLKSIRKGKAVVVDELPIELIKALGDEGKRNC